MGEHLRVIQIAQCVLLGITCWLVYDMGRRIFALRVGVLAGIACMTVYTDDFWRGVVKAYGRWSPVERGKRYVMGAACFARNSVDGRVELPTFALRTSRGSGRIWLDRNGVERARSGSRSNAKTRVFTHVSA